MQKRVVFRSRLLPYLLVLPQIVITVIFFFWPAYQALESSFFIEDAFGFSREWVAMQNYIELFEDPGYLRSFKTTLVFGVSVAVMAMSISLDLAVAANRVVNLVYAFFDTFALIHATTEGGPVDATSILVFRVYNTGFIGQNYGSSAAQSVILMGLVVMMTFVQFRFIERKVQY